MSSRTRTAAAFAGPDAETSFAVYGPDPLEPVRDAIVLRDPDALARCFAVEGQVRVPRPDGDILIRGRADLARAGRDVQSMIRELSWTPSRRFVSADEVTEEAVVLAHLHQRRAGRAGTGTGPPGPESLRVPLRVVATIEPGGLISGLTLWLDWAALSDPKGVTSAGGAASALVAQARSRDDRGLRVLQAPARSAFVSPPDAGESAGEPEPDRPEPMSRGSIWWELHRRAVAGTAMALTAVLLLSWVGLTVLGPLVSSSSARSAALGGSGANPDTDPGSSGPGAGPGSARGSDPATGTVRGADTTAPGNPPVVSSQTPDVRPTVQAGTEILFLSDVLFPFGSWELSPRANQRLDKLAGQIRRAGVLGTVQVNGYTDSIGSGRSNLDLSRDRARAVAVALSNRLGDVQIQLVVQAFGETSPRATNRTDAGRRQNRVVVVVLPEER